MCGETCWRGGRREPERTRDNFTDIVWSLRILVLDCYIFITSAGLSGLFHSMWTQLLILWTSDEHVVTGIDRFFFPPHFSFELVKRMSKARRNTDYFLTIAFLILCLSLWNTRSWSKFYCGWRSTRDADVWLYSRSRMLFNFNNEIMILLAHHERKSYSQSSIVDKQSWRRSTCSGICSHYTRWLRELTLIDPIDCWFHSKR